MTRAGIVGMGLWTPDVVRKNDAWPESFALEFRRQTEGRKKQDFTHIEKAGAARPYDELYEKHAGPHDADPFKGAFERRVAPADLPTAECDARAVAQALKDARLEARDIDLVLSSALVPDRIIPSNGPAIQHLAGCSKAAGVGVEAACSSALVQLELAAALVESGRARHVLCVQSHQIARALPLHLPFSPIFGDGSAAFVVGPVREDRGVTRVLRGGEGALAGAVTWNYPGRPSTDWWRDAQGGVQPGSDDPGGARYIARNVVAFAVDTIRELCEAAEMPLDAVAAIAMIQPLIWYQPAVAEGLGVASERVPSSYPRFAHLGAAGVVANLLEARQRGLLHDGAPVVLYAHGAGLTRYAALIHWGR
jgi:3-oxoacyl-[acyl-carrier-protein] synthase-3